MTAFDPRTDPAVRYDFSVLTSGDFADVRDANARAARIATFTEKSDLALDFAGEFSECDDYVIFVPLDQAADVFITFTRVGLWNTAPDGSIDDYVTTWNCEVDDDRLADLRAAAERLGFEVFTHGEV